MRGLFSVAMSRSRQLPRQLFSRTMSSRENLVIRYGLLSVYCFEVRATLQLSGEP